MDSSMESSYENVEPEVNASYKSEITDEIREELSEELDESSLHGVKFRRVPVAEALEGDRDRIGRCSRKTGHVLQVKDGKITCANCPVEWKNEGY